MGVCIPDQTTVDGFVCNVGVLVTHRQLGGSSGTVTFGFKQTNQWVLHQLTVFCTSVQNPEGVFILLMHFTNRASNGTTRVFTDGLTFPTSFKLQCYTYNVMHEATYLSATM